MKNKVLKEIYEEIKKSKRVLILSHQNPDGDAISSQLALSLVIKRMGILVDILAVDIPNNLKIIPGIENIKMNTNENYDLIILVDVSLKNRLGVFEYLYDSSKKIIVIDHHELKVDDGILHYINPSLASATIALYEFFIANNIEVDKTLATYLYIGILTDTGGFANKNTNTKTFEVATALLSTGINHHELYTEYARPEYDMAYLMLEKEVINNLEIIDNKIAFSFLSKEICEKYHYDTPKKFVNVGKNIKDVEVSVILIEESETYRVSIRSKSSIDAAQVAQAFKGGGHKYASGFRIKGEYDTIKKSIIEEIKNNY